MDRTRAERIRQAFGQAINALLEETVRVENAPRPGEYDGEIRSIGSLQGQLNELREKPLPTGELIGWKSLEPYYRPAKGQWTVVTGIPSHGKSTWLDCLVTQLVDKTQWKFGMFSAENQPVERHAKSLLAKYYGHPFEQIGEREFQYAIKKLGDRIFLLDPQEEHLSLDYILDMALYLIKQFQIDGFVIDPWNELDHSGRGAFQTETEYISQSLSKLRRFTRHHNIHLWLVAHPYKLYRDKNGHVPVPGLYEISGSAAWRNKCDFGITVWRDLKNEGKPVKIHVLKVRFADNGKLGTIPLRFDPVSGRYFDIKPGELFE